MKFNNEEEYLNFIGLLNKTKEEQNEDNEDMSGLEIIYDKIKDQIADCMLEEFGVIYNGKEDLTLVDSIKEGCKCVFLSTAELEPLIQKAQNCLDNKKACTNNILNVNYKSNLSFLTMPNNNHSSNQHDTYDEDERLPAKKAKLDVA